MPMFHLQVVCVKDVDQEHLDLRHCEMTALDS